MVNRAKCKFGASGTYAGTSYETSFEVALSTGFKLYHILERACLSAEQLRCHLSSGCVGV